MSKKHKHEHDEHVDESWLIPYADLLTLLLALFIVLFATSKNLDMKKVDAMQKVFQSIITGGMNVFEFYAPLETTKDQEEQTKTEEELQKAIEQLMQAGLLPSPSASSSANPEQQPTPSPSRDPSESPLPSPEDAQKQKEEQFDEESKELEDLKKKLDKFISQQNMQMQLQTALNKQQLLITIRDQALFPPGTADLKKESIDLAKAISAMLAPYQQFQVRVGGHTDDLPINSAVFPSNWDLSSKRAINFLKVLLGNQVIDPTKYSAVGYAEFQPIADNDTPEGRAKNRRVEISILRNVIENEGQMQRQAVAP
jgi:chemotaxis protein MotB